MFFPQWIVAIILAGVPATGTITDIQGHPTVEACIEYATTNAPRIADWVRGSRGLTLNEPVAVVGATCVDTLPAQPEDNPRPPDRKA